MRDYVLHNTAADKFYRKQDVWDDNIDYKNPNVDLETIDRLIVPRDIDAAFYNSAAMDMMSMKLQNDSNFRVSKKLELQDYLPSKLNGFKHYKWIITCNISPLLHSCLMREPAFELDILVWEGGIIPLLIQERLPPFGDVDFECNKLVLFQSHFQEILTMDNSTHNCPLKHNANLQRILKDTENKRAVFTHTQICEHRVKKMIDKGFSIETQNMIVVPAIYSSADKGICTICHEDIDGMHVKRKCCHAKYHGKCLDKVYDKCESCPQCRAQFHDALKKFDVVLCRIIDILATDTITFAEKTEGLSDEESDDHESNETESNEVQTS